MHWNLYLQLHSIIAEVNIFVAQKVTGCLDKLHIQSPSMQMKKWLAQKTLYTNVALLTRSLGKPSITPTQAKKLVTRGIDFHTLLLLRRTSDAFVASLKQKGVRSKPLGEKLYRALCSTYLFFQAGSFQSHCIPKYFTLNNNPRVFLTCPRLVRKLKLTKLCKE